MVACSKKNKKWQTKKCKTVQCENGKTFKFSTRRCVKEKVTKTIYTKKTSQSPLPHIEDISKIKLLDSGSYGCVIQPSLHETLFTVQSETYKNPNNLDIGKIFKEANSYKKELKEVEKIKKLDPQHIFTPEIKAYGKIEYNIIKKLPTEIVRCLNYKSTFSYQIVMEYGGENIHNTNYKMNYPDLIKSFLTLIEGMMLLKKNNYIHRDIKPLNVLVKKNKFTLIDFGLAINVNRVYNKSEHFVLDSTYKYYPPEFYIAYAFNKLDLRKKTITLNDLKDVENFLEKNHYYHYLSEPDYLNYLKQRNKTFLDTIYTKKLTKFKDIFNKELAFKSDVFSLSFIIDKYKKNIIFSTNKKIQLKQKNFIENIISKMYKHNSFERYTIEDVYNEFKKEVS